MFVTVSVGLHNLRTDIRLLDVRWTSGVTPRALVSCACMDVESPKRHVVCECLPVALHDCVTEEKNPAVGFELAVTEQNTGFFMIFKAV